MRLLQGWGLGAALDAVACFPQRLEVRSAHSGALLGSLPLGARAATLWRALRHDCAHRFA
jgi:salicylate hydroxylase